MMGGDEDRKRMGLWGHGSPVPWLGEDRAGLGTEQQPLPTVR